MAGSSLELGRCSSTGITEGVPNVKLRVRGVFRRNFKVILVDVMPRDINKQKHSLGEVDPERTIDCLICRSCRNMDSRRRIYQDGKINAKQKMTEDVLVLSSN